jgi:hypothetical protein
LACDDRTSARQLPGRIRQRPPQRLEFGRLSGGFPRRLPEPAGARFRLMRTAGARAEQTDRERQSGHSAPCGRPRPKVSSNQIVLPPRPNTSSPIAQPPHRSAKTSRMSSPRPLSGSGGGLRGRRNLRVGVPDTDPEDRVQPGEPDARRAIGVPDGVGGQLGRQQLGPARHLTQSVGGEYGVQRGTGDARAARISGEAEFVLPGFGERGRYGKRGHAGTSVEWVRCGAVHGRRPRDGAPNGVNADRPDGLGDRCASVAVGAATGAA